MLDELQRLAEVFETAAKLAKAQLLTTTVPGHICMTLRLEQVAIIADALEMYYRYSVGGGHP